MNVRIQQLDPDHGFEPMPGTAEQEDDLESIFDLRDPTERSEYLLAMEMLTTGNMWVFETHDGSLWRLTPADQHCTLPPWSHGGIAGEGYFA